MMGLSKHAHGPLCLLEISQVNWSAAVETLFKVSGLGDEERAILMASDMAVTLQCRDFFVELGNLLSTTPSRHYDLLIFYCPSFKFQRIFFFVIGQ